MFKTEPTDDTEDDEDLPYPSAVVGIIDAVAWLGLVLGVLGGLAVMLSHHNSTSLDGTTSTDKSMSVIVGIAIMFGSMIQWAFFRAASLVVQYLWVIQANTTE